MFLPSIFGAILSYTKKGVNFGNHSDWADLLENKKIDRDLLLDLSLGYKKLNYSIKNPSNRK